MSGFSGGYARSAYRTVRRTLDAQDSKNEGSGTPTVSVTVKREDVTTVELEYFNRVGAVLSVSDMEGFVARCKEEGIGLVKVGPNGLVGTYSVSATGAVSEKGGEKA